MPDEGFVKASHSASRLRRNAAGEVQYQQYRRLVCAELRLLPSEGGGPDKPIRKRFPQLQNGCHAGGCQIEDMQNPAVMHMVRSLTASLVVSERT